MKFANGVPDDLAANLAHDRRARRPEDVQPLPDRLGDGVQHAVQDVEALRVQRRHVRPVHHLVARRDRRRAARSASSTTTRSISSRRSSTCSASSRPRRSRGTRRARSTASACATASTTRPPRRIARPSSTRCSARARSGTRAGRPSRPIRSSPGWGNFNDDEWELYHTDVDRAESTTSPPSSRTSSGADQHLVLGGRRQRRVPARRPLTGRDLRDAAAAALRARDRYVYFPDAAPVSEWQAVNMKNRSFVIARARRHPVARRRGCALRARVAVRRPRALRQGQPPPLRQQLRRHRRAADRRLRGRPDRREPDPVGVVREEGRRPTSPPPGRCRSTTATRRSARGRSRPSSGRSRSRARALYVGRHAGEPLTDDYPGEPPYAFTGGTLHEVAVDVSGEPYIDLERHAEMLLKPQ